MGSPAGAQGLLTGNRGTGAPRARLLLAGMLLGAAAGLALLAGPSYRAVGTPPTRTSDGESAGSVLAASHGGRVALAPRPSALPAPEGDGAAAGVDAERPDTEREHLLALHALALADPEALERRAGEVLDGAGPCERKVALLRALEDTGAAGQLDWLAHAARLVGDERPCDERVAEFALERLLGRASEPEVRRTLAGLMRDETRNPVALRRRAAAGLALHAPSGELHALRLALVAERDELLLAGVRASRLERDDEPARRVLGSTAWPTLEPSPARR